MLLHLNNFINLVKRARVSGSKEIRITTKEAEDIIIDIVENLTTEKLVTKADLKDIAELKEIKPKINALSGGNFRK